MNTTWLGLAGGVAAVTGGGGGIGRAIALELAAAGCRVAVIDRDDGAANMVAAEITATGGEAVGLGCDVGDRAAVAAMVRATETAFGPCTVLVNNAGVLRPGHLDTLDPADWSAVLDINLTGYLSCAQAFGHSMRQQGHGSIVNVASIAAAHPQAYSGAYSSAKAAVVMLTRQIAFEWGPFGVRCNAVSPGLIRTPLSESFYRAPGIEERRRAVVPTRAIGRPEDIATVVAFLCSPKAGYVTGQDLTVDGGFSQTLMSHIPRPGYDHDDA